MVLDKLSTSLKATLKKIANALFVDEKLVDEVVKDIQRALLQADVNVQLVFTLSKAIKKRALEEKPPKTISPREHLIKIVYGELVQFLGKEQKGITIEKKKPFKIMMVGLFGSGKCVHPESAILLSTGETLSVESLYQRYTFAEKEQIADGEIIDITSQELFLPSFNPKTLKIENKKATHLWKLKGKDLLEIFLDNGNDFSVKVTPEHPFFALRKGELQQIRADELILDDFVAIPRRYSQKPSKINLFDALKKLDISVLLGARESRKLFLSMQSTKLKIHENLKYTKNYCNFTQNIKQGIVPIEFLTELKGYKIKLKRANTFISFPEYMTTDLSEFLGYVIGDGHLERKVVSIFNEDEEVIDRIVNLSRQLFGIEPVLMKDKRAKKLYRISLGSTTLVQILNTLFNISIGKKGKQLRVPLQIMKENSSCAIAFIRAYFDCEAYPSKQVRQIEVMSESSFLINGISVLLLRLGILSSISKKFVKDTPYWRLSIRSRYAEKYAEKIGFLISRKQKKVNAYNQIGIKQGCGKQDIIPLSRYLEEIRTSNGFSIGELQEVCNSYGRYEALGMISRESLYKINKLYLREGKGNHYDFLNSIKHKIELRSQYSHSAINSFLSYYGKEDFITKSLTLTKKEGMLLQKKVNKSQLHYLISMAESEVCWIRVRDICGIEKPEYVYDLTVEENHSFIANNIIVHNTTSISKIAKYYTKRGYKVAALGLDIHRPAAPEQLEQVCKQANIPAFIDKKEKNPLKIYKSFEKEYSKYDILIIDTAGRDALSKDLIEEITKLNKEIKPDERLLVISADIGQAAQQQATAFHDAVNITGILITKLDGTAKAGGALSACSVTKAPVKFIGVGEKIDDLEEFDPERFVSRLLGMGDLKTLLEKAEEAIDSEKAEDLGKKFLKGDFNFLDLYEQLQAMQKMGPLTKVMDLIPGMSNVNIPKDMINVQESKLKRWKHILNSMTKEELEDPEILTRTRIERIAKGSGSTTSEVRELLKQYKQAKKLAKVMKGMEKETDITKLMRKFKGKIPGIK